MWRYQFWRLHLPTGEKTLGAMDAPDTLTRLRARREETMIFWNGHISQIIAALAFIINRSYDNAIN
jgi:hypothetical protein